MSDLPPESSSPDNASALKAAIDDANKKAGGDGKDDLYDEGPRTLVLDEVFEDAKGAPVGKNTDWKKTKDHNTWPPDEEDRPTGLTVNEHDQLLRKRKLDEQQDPDVKKKGGRPLAEDYEHVDEPTNAGKVNDEDYTALLLAKSMFGEGWEQRTVWGGVVTCPVNPFIEKNAAVDESGTPGDDSETEPGIEDAPNSKGSSNNKARRRNQKTPPVASAPKTVTPADKAKVSSDKKQSSTKKNKTKKKRVSTKKRILAFGMFAAEPL